MKKKTKIKELELQVSCLTALLAEYVVKDAIRRIPVPDTKGSKEGLAIVSDGTAKEVVLSAEQYANNLKMIMRGGQGVSMSEQQRQHKDKENKESFFLMDKDGNKHPINPPYEFTNDTIENEPPPLRDGSDFVAKSNKQQKQAKEH